jgi:hypothetical protein
MTGMFGGIGNAGGIGLWSLLAALFARGNATETLMLLLYGIMIESGRRLFTWLSERILISTSHVIMRCHWSLTTMGSRTEHYCCLP